MARRHLSPTLLVPRPIEQYMSILPRIFNLVRENRARSLGWTTRAGRINVTADVSICGTDRSWIHRSRAYPTSICYRCCHAAASLPEKGRPTGGAKSGTLPSPSPYLTLAGRSSKPEARSMNPPGRQADDRALDSLIPHVFPELKKIARSLLQNERCDITLQATDLVSEFYMQVANETKVGTTGRSYLFGAATRAMKRILVEHARRRGALIRGGDLCKVTLTPEVAVTADNIVDGIALNQALADLRKLDERQAEVVELRCYGGLTVSEVAEFLDVCESTVKMDWRLGRAWLRRELEAHPAAPIRVPKK